MPVLADFHIHSHHSGDCEAPMGAVIRAAQAAALTDICFTEHLDFDYPGYHDLAADAFLLNDNAYEQEFRNLKRNQEDFLTLHFGIECGMQPGCVEKNIAFLHRKPYDFVLGSVHLCDGADPYYPQFYETHPDEASALLLYFEETLHNIELFHDFDVLAHLDYMVRYCHALSQHTDYARYRDIIDAILECLIRFDKGLEINTGGLRKGMSETNPSVEVIRRFRELGGRILTVGSDAHRPEDVGAGFSVAAAVLRDAGFSQYAVFSRRTPSLRPID